MSYDQIFASPPEPFFNLKGSCLSHDLLHDLLATQRETNEGALKLHGTIPRYFKEVKLAECVFLLCEHFSQPPDTRYLALELLDKLFTDQVGVFFNTIAQSSSSNEEKVDQWKMSMDKFSSQSVPFIVVCAQIGSKLCSHHKVITNRKAVSFLRSAGYHLSGRDLLQLELEILQTIHFKVNLTSPLTYVETILEIIGHENPAISVKVLHDICLRVLDLVYLERPVIYDRLFSVTTGNQPSSAKHRHEFSVVENDVMLLAAGVIGAASYITGKLSSDEIIEYLVDVTKIPSNDVVDFATIIIENIISHDE